jgi:hypothetical protein
MVVSCAALCGCQQQQRHSGKLIGQRLLLLPLQLQLAAAMRSQQKALLLLLLLL